jgi:hypothetical protein
VLLNATEREIVQTAEHAACFREDLGFNHSLDMENPEKPVVGLLISSSHIHGLHLNLGQFHLRSLTNHYVIIILQFSVI